MLTPVRRPHNPARSRLALFGAVVLVASLLALVAAPGADAATYRAVQCSERVGAGRQDASFRANSPRYVGSADCAGPGLSIEHEPGRKATSAGRWGVWRLTAPPSTRIVGAVAGVRAAAGGGHVPQVAIGLGGGREARLPNVRGERHQVRWSGERGRFVLGRLTCARNRCGAGRDAFLHLRRIALTLKDLVAPTIEPTGSLLAAGSRRGTESLQVAATDAGGGVQNVTVEVNGRPLAARQSGCATRDRLALRLRPCPDRVAPAFEITTRAPEFRQGPNHVRVCAADYAPRQNANRRCAGRIVRIDNLCPVSGEEAAELRARFVAARARISTRSDRRTAIAGTLADAAGRPVSGARVCIAERVRMAGAAERVVANPLTDASGRFRATLAAGPSREVRVAHWPDADRALERHLDLESRAIPRLRLRPQRTLRNGQRLRFLVRIPGPANGNRQIEVQARSGSGWIRIARGRTGAKGTWHGGYRFRDTTGKRTYSFRAFVGRQPGYPYAAGRSEVRHATVIGP